MFFQLRPVRCYKLAKETGEVQWIIRGYSTKLKNCHLQKYRTEMRLVETGHAKTAG